MSRSGNRSRSAVGILNGAGLDDVFNMERGILAYNGLVAAGSPEAGVFCFIVFLSRRDNDFNLNRASG